MSYRPRWRVSRETLRRWEVRGLFRGVRGEGYREFGGCPGRSWGFCWEVIGKLAEGQWDLARGGGVWPKGFIGSLVYGRSDGPTNTRIRTHKPTDGTSDTATGQ